MKKKYLAIAALSMALAAGSAMTSFAAGFVHTSQGTKYQWVPEITVPITG